MVNHLFKEAFVYVVENPSKLLRKLNFLVTLLDKNKIITTVNITDYKSDFCLKDISVGIEPQLQIYLSNNLIWFFADDIYEYSQIFKEIELEFKSYINKVDVTDKVFVQSIFDSGFSDNLLEVNIDGDDLLEFEEETLTGCFINKSFEYGKIIEYKDINIRYLKIQPYKINVVLTLRRPNIVEFSNHIDRDNHLKLIKDFSLYSYKANKNIIHYKREKEE